MKKLLLTAALAATLSTSVYAEGLFTPDPVEDWSYSLSYNFYTSHPSSDGFTKDGEVIKWNENNKVSGIRVNVNENIGYFVAHGDNSYYEKSTLGGVEFSTDTRNLEVGSDLGIATGYYELVSVGTLPFINPFVRASVYPVESLKLSVKLGNVNFMAVNAHAELTFNF